MRMFMLPQKRLEIYSRWQFPDWHREALQDLIDPIESAYGNADHVPVGELVKKGWLRARCALCWIRGRESNIFLITSSLHFLWKMFAQTLNLVDDVLDYDYQELINNFLVIGAICAVILGAMYQQLRKVKFSTPYQISEWFYLGMDFRQNNNGDERFGVSINRYYFGVYDNTAQWGKLDENGCLWLILMCANSFSGTVNEHRPQNRVLYTSWDISLQWPSPNAIRNFMICVRN